MAKIISGISNCGKSTYLKEFGEKQIVFAYQFNTRFQRFCDRLSGRRFDLFHYNIARIPNFSDDHSLIYGMKKIDSAVVVYAKKSTLIERATLRKYVEPDHNNYSGYDSKAWIRKINEMDIEGLYYSWVSFLSNSGVRIEYIRSSNDGTTKVTNFEEMIE